MQKILIKYFFKKPHLIPPETFNQIKNLIIKEGGVGKVYIDDNLRDAYLVGYACDGDRVIGTVTHKIQKEDYRKKLEAATGLDLSGYIERGYTAVEPQYRKLDIADALIKGLIERSKRKKIYVTIRLDNVPPLKLAYKNGMAMVAKYVHHKTGNELGLFINQRALPPALLPQGKKHR